MFKLHTPVDDMRRLENVVDQLRGEFAFPLHFISCFVRDCHFVQYINRAFSLHNLILFLFLPVAPQGLCSSGRL